MADLVQGAQEHRAPADLPRPSLFELFWQFMIIGAVSFGGGIIAYEQILLVEKKKWLDLDDFMATLAISQTMPGLNSVTITFRVRTASRSAIADHESNSTRRI